MVRDGKTISEDEVKQYCMGQLAKFKTPEYVWFIDEFPTTVTGKIQKFRLREMAVEKFNLQAAARVETA